jgi:hypothetical protein
MERDAEGTRSFLALLVGSLLGACFAYILLLPGFDIPAWLSALIVTVVAVAGGVIGTGWMTGGPAATGT